jgi:hypothetical protein
MKKLLFAVFLAITMLFNSPFEGYAQKTSVSVSAHYKAGHGHRGWEHPGRWRRDHRGPRIYWRGSFVMVPWQIYPYYAPPPVIIQQPPPVYVQPEQHEDLYWYYCPEPQGYYPYIQNCETGWMKVVPDATPPNP